MDRIPERLAEIVGRADRGPDGFECRREGTDHHVRLWGHLAPDWAGNFALHTFATGIHVLAADAMRTRDSLWVASFLLRGANPREPLRHDFLTMARRAPRGTPPLPEPPVSIGIRLSEESPGDVYAHVVGKDSIGLIAQVLRHFERFDLRPKRFVIRTRGDDVEDWLWLEPRVVPSSRVVPIDQLEADWRGSIAPL